MPAASSRLGGEGWFLRPNILCVERFFSVHLPIHSFVRGEAFELWSQVACLSRGGTIGSFVLLGLNVRSVDRGYLVFNPKIYWLWSSVKR